MLTQAVTRIGRDPASDIVLRNRFVSSTHAEVHLLEGGLVLQDMRSTNGSRVRREGAVIPVDGSCGHRLELRSGDELLLGEEEHAVTLRVFLSTSLQEHAGLGIQTAGCLPMQDLGAVLSGLERETLLSLQRLGLSLASVPGADGVALALAEWLLDQSEGASDVFVHLREPSTGALTRAARRGPSTGPGSLDQSQALATELVSSGSALAYSGRAGDTAVARIGACAPVLSSGDVIALVETSRPAGRGEEAIGPGELELLALAAAESAPALALRRLEAVYKGTVEQAVKGIVGVVESRDAYMAGHASAVSQLATRIGARMHLSPEALARVERAGVLHDIGRVGVPPEVLNAPGTLTKAQFDRVRAAPAIGASLVEQFGFLSDLVPLIRHVHERWDGSGYPDGLAGEDIPLEARVVAVADAFHTMVSHRAHQEAMSQEVALAEIAAAAGTRFDPRVVGALEVTVLSSDDTWEFDAKTCIGTGFELRLALPGKK